MGASPHNVAGWAKLLIYMKKKQSPPGYNAALRDLINLNAEMVYGHWRPSLRYRIVPPLAAEVSAVRNAANWFAEKQAGF